jgi:hypothetical protein
MKIKVMGLTEQDIENGFEIGKNYEVNRVDISGDTYSYDIWYQISNGKYNTCLQDLSGEDVEYDERIDKVLNDIESLLEKYDFPIKFNIEMNINLEK